MKSFSERSENLSTGSWALVLLGLLVVAVFGIRTISNADFWVHLAVGRDMAGSGISKLDSLSFTAVGGNWVNPSWLYDRMLHGLWQVSQGPLIVLLHALLAVAAFALLVPVARKWAGGVSISLALLLSAWMLAPRFVIGPAVPALLFAAVMILVLSRESKAWVPWVVVVPVQILWVNMHSSFLLGPVICAAFAAEAYLGARAEGADAALAAKTFKSLTVLAVVALLLSLVNPYGLRLPGHVLAMATDVTALYGREWISAFSSQFALSAAAKHLVTIALLIGAGGLITERRRLPVAVTTTAVIGAFLVVRSLWYIDLFSLLAFPFLALSLGALGEFVRSLSEKGLGAGANRLPVAGAILAVVIAVLSFGAVLSNGYYQAVGSASSFGTGVEYDQMPNAAATIMERDEFPDRAVNLIADGGFLLWRYPGRSVFIDARPGIYDASLFAELNKCMAGNADALKELTNRWQPGAMIINCCVPGAARAARGMLLSGEWVLAYFDGTTAVLLNAKTSNQALARDPAVQQAGLDVLERERKRYAGRLGTSRGPGISPRLIGAGSFYIEMGRYREAKAVYTLLTRGIPSMAGSWFGLGVAELQLGNLDAAESALKVAAERNRKNVWPWLQLSRVYQARQDKQGEQWALDRARAVNPAVVAAFREAQANSAAPATP